MNIYGYCRVSTDSQVDGQSLTVQERTIQGYCLMHDYPLTTTYVEEGVSASIPFAERSQGSLLLARLKPRDILITPKLDRMFRSSLDALSTLHHFQENDIHLHMLDLGGDVTSNGLSKLVFTILSAVAEAERDRIRDRIKEVKRDQRSRGLYLGGIVPYGFIKDGNRLTEDPVQQEIINQIKNYRAKGFTLRRLAKAFSLSHACVRSILSR